MGHITTWEEDYKGNNTSPSLQSPLANSSSPSCRWKKRREGIELKRRKDGNEHNV
jgi:hypothetical protein